jgi:hypothetical protein
VYMWLYLVWLPLCTLWTWQNLQSSENVSKKRVGEPHSHTGKSKCTFQTNFNFWFTNETLSILPNLHGRSVVASLLKMPKQSPLLSRMTVKGTQCLAPAVTRRHVDTSPQLTSKDYCSVVSSNDNDESVPFCWLVVAVALLCSTSVVDLIGNHHYGREQQSQHWIKLIGCWTLKSCCKR